MSKNRFNENAPSGQWPEGAFFALIRWSRTYARTPPEPNRLESQRLE